MPRNHGRASWVFLSSFGGGMVDGDEVDLLVDVGPGAFGLLGTQASTKVYRSPNGCLHRLEVRVAAGGSLAVVADPVVCFAGARYGQRIDVTLEPCASVLLLDAYTSGRAARGERWRFDRFESRTTVTRAGGTLLVDATRLDPAHGAVAERMGRFDVVVSLVTFGPAFEGVRAAMPTARASVAPGDRAIAAAAPLRGDGAIVRVAADHFEYASRVLRPSFEALAAVLGDDPFARKW